MSRAVPPELHSTDELELITVGGNTGREHRVTLAFAYQDPFVWVRTDQRPAAPDATGVRRRSGRDRDPDWLRNLESEPSCRIRVAGVELRARYERSTDADADLRRTVELMRAKFGTGWVEDWYVDRGRVPVRLRLE